MKQVIMNYRTGKVELADVPVPSVKKGCLLVKNAYSAISVGTESLMIRTGKSSIIKKAKDRPDLVKRVIDKLKTEGIAETIRQVMNRLDEPIPLGYSCAGIVEEVGNGVTDFKIGDRVACFGSGFASHADYVCVPQNLAVKVPSDVDLKEAAIAGIAAISLHAIRLAEVSIGDVVVVYGLGLLGLIAVQILKALGARVVGVDINPDRLKIGQQIGCDGVSKPDLAMMKEIVDYISNGTGADAVILFVSGGGMDVLYNSANLLRDKGRIVATGMLELEIPRKDFFEKEIELVVSRGAGAGMFDPNYEEKNFDYPVGYAKWTIKRNMEEILNLLSSRKLDLEKIITNVFDFENAPDVYEKIVNGSLNVIGALFKYGENVEKQKMIIIHDVERKISSASKNKKPVVIGVIGAGLFAKTTMFPILKKMQKRGEVRLKYVATTRSHTSYHAARKYGFENAVTDYRIILDDPEVDAIMIFTQHNTHAKFVIESLNANKHVFVEKPLALTLEELDEIKRVYQQHNDKVLMVGFNRRYSPHARFLREAFKDIPGPYMVLCRVNAGYVDKNSWVLDPEKGGGRFVGEACHFVDLITYLTGELPVDVDVKTVEPQGGKYSPRDNFIATIKLSKGSVGVIIYYSNGNKRFPRELVEISANGVNGRIDNFVRSEVIGSRSKKKRTFGVDRGHVSELEKFVEKLRSELYLDFEEIYSVSRLSIIGENKLNY